MNFARLILKEQIRYIVRIVIDVVLFEIMSFNRFDENAVAPLTSILSAYTLYK